MRAGSAAILGALVLSGCAARTHTAVPTAAVRPAGVGQFGRVSYGIILAERPVTIGAVNNATGTVAGGLAGSDVRSSILAAIGDAGLSGQAGSASDGETPGGRVSEFIVRVDGGGTISVVQSNGPKLQPGARVMIIRGAETRLAPQAQS